MLADNHARNCSNARTVWKPVSGKRYEAPRTRSKWIGLNRGNEL